MSGTRLTKGAILYISVGFTQDCLLQVLSLQHSSEHTLAMVVYDGQVYSGAFYHLPIANPQLNQLPMQIHSRILTGAEENGVMLTREVTSVRELDVIEVKAIPSSPNQPIELTELKVVASGLTDILGQQILSLQEYMRRRKFCRVSREEEPAIQENLGEKRVKTNTEDSKEMERLEVDDQKLNRVVGIEGQIASFVQLQDIILKDKEKGSNKGSPERDIPKENVLEGKSAYLEGFQEGEREIEQILKQPQMIDNSSVSPPQPLTLSNPQQVMEKPDQIGEQVEFVEVKPFHPVEQDSSNSLQRIKEKIADLPQANLPLFPSLPNKPTVIELLEDEGQEILTTKPGCSSRIIDLDEQIRSGPGSSLFASQKGTKSQQVRLGEEHILVTDLYERMHRFRLLCRINHISTFTYPTGKSCTRLSLVDEQGNELLCHLFRKANEKVSSHQLELLRGRAYYFENGEVEQDDSIFLFISVPWSGIRLTSLKIDPFHPSKMKRVSSVENIEAKELLGKTAGGSCNSINSKAHSKEINVCGIFKGFKDEPKLVNNQFRTQGVLLDPDHDKSITFCLFLDQLSTFPKEGAVISLHNMRVTEYQNTFKLDSSKRSYYLVHNNTSMAYLKDLQESSRKGSWKLNQYRNLSEVRYVSRSIAQLKKLLTCLTEQDQCHSEIDVANMSEKREYLACLSCQHETKPAKGTHTYCFHCKKIQKFSQRFLFRAEVADGTGSLEISLSNPQADLLLRTPPEEYARMSRAERETILELGAFQNVLLRIRSERTLGGAIHFATRAEKVDHRRTYDRIKETQVENRTRMISQW